MPQLKGWESLFFYCFWQMKESFFLLLMEITSFDSTTDEGWHFCYLLLVGKKTCDVSTTRKRFHHVSIADKEKGPQVCFYYRSRRPTLMRESAHPPSFHCWWRRGHRSANLHSIWSGCLLGTLPILYNKVNIISHYHTVTSMIS